MNNEISMLAAKVDELLMQQKISNFIAISNNPNVPEDVRQSSLATAMAMMGLQSNLTQQSVASQTFESLSQSM